MLLSMSESLLTLTDRSRTTMTENTFYFSLSTGKVYTPAEAAGMKTLGGKVVQKPKLAPTALNDYWFAASERAIDEIDALVQLAGDDERDEFAAERSLDSEALGVAASVVLGKVTQEMRLTRNLNRAVRSRAEYGHISGWIVQVIDGLLDQGGNDWIDADELKVMRQIRKLLAR